MKKFIALLMALVMALSLATVAWGANPYTAGTPAELATAVSSAVNTGDIIKLTADIEITDGITVTPGVIIDGAGYTLTVTGEGGMAADTTEAAIFSTGAISVKNLTIVGGSRGIYINGTLATDIVIDNVEIVNSCRAINVTSSGANAAMTISNSTLAGKISYQENVTPVTFENCEFVINASVKGNVVEPYSSTSFDNCVFAAGSTVSLDDVVTATPDATIAMTDCVYAGEPLSDDNMDDLLTISAGNTVPSTLVTSTSATVGTATTSFYVADSAATTKWSLIDVFPGTAPVAFFVEADYEEDLSKANAGGNLDHYVINGDYYVVASKNAAEYKLVYGATVIYLNAAADVDYEAQATAFTGVTTDDEACGKVLVSKANLKKTYYTATVKDGKTPLTYYFVKAAAGDVDLLVDGVIVKADVVANNFDPTDADNAFIFHAWEGNDIDATTKAYTSVKCENCGKVAKLYANADAAGKNAVYLADFASWITLADAGFAPVVVTPSTDKTVTSADTFDAGIAMYVGMSVMAAAGSAVVIGKKKD